MEISSHFEADWAGAMWEDVEEDLPEGAGMGNEQQRQEQQENTH